MAQHSKVHPHLSVVCIIFNNDFMSLDIIDEAEADIVSELVFLSLLDGLMLKGLDLIQMEESNGVRDLL